MLAVVLFGADSDNRCTPALAGITAFLLHEFGLAYCVPRRAVMTREDPKHFSASRLLEYNSKVAYTQLLTRPFLSALVLEGRCESAVVESSTR